MSEVELRPRLCVALDNIELSETVALADELRSLGVLWVKVGLELYLKGGFPLIERLKGRGFCVFVDLKFHDIPNTVRQAVSAISNSGADLTTVHCAGGIRMLEAAAAGAIGSTIKIVGVTVLTSISDSEFQQFSQIFGGPQDLTLHRHKSVFEMAKLAARAGLHGIVSSVSDLKDLICDIKKLHWNEAPLFVTPGIREEKGQSDDQSFVATPQIAVQAGSRLLVVGRPILKPNADETRSEAVRRFLKVIEASARSLTE